jgi:hypothetical protein
MPKYMIERRIPGAGRWTQEELQSISRRSVQVLYQMGPQVQWVSSTIADDTVYCTYIADNEGVVREHARAAGFPVDNISVIRTVIDPATAED